MWADDWKKGLDLDRLHGPHVHRKSGKTMACIAAMFGEAMLGQPANAYLYVAENYPMRTWVCRDFREILEYEGVSVTPNGGYRQHDLYVDINRLFVKGWQGTRTFDFMAASELETGIRARQWDLVFLDISSPLKIMFAESIDTLKQHCNRKRSKGEFFYGHRSYD